LLAHLEDGVGAFRERAVLKLAEQDEASVYVSIINLGELTNITEREQGLVAAQTALNAIEQLSIHILDATRDRVLAAAHIEAHVSIS
jgi:predicted nucleic acid-binding protein